MAYDSNTLSQRLQERIGAKPWQMWFEHASLGLEAGRLVVRTGSKFEADWIARRFAEDLDGLARDLGESTGGVDVVPSERTDDAGTLTDPPRAAEPTPRRRTSRARLHDLDDMVVGPSNRLAWTAAMGLVDDEQACHLSPLFIHGGCGVGKTHLLQGICRRLRDRVPSSVRYMTGEQFTNEFIQAVRLNQLERFRRSMRSLRLLAIDDVHFVAGKEKTQNEILHTLDAIKLGGARLALASDAHPSTIRRFNASLVSRFTSGMLVGVDPPEERMRREVATRIATGRHLALETEALDLVVEHCRESIREVQGLMARLEAMHLMHSSSESINAGHVHEAIHRFSGAVQRPLTLAMIVQGACEVLHVQHGDLVGSGRSSRVVLARGLAATIARESTTGSFPEIARALGRRAHSSVHAAVNRTRLDLENGRTISLDGTEVPLERIIDRIRRRARSC